MSITGGWNPPRIKEEKLLAGEEFELFAFAFDSSVRYHTYAAERLPGGEWPMTQVASADMPAAGRVGVSTGSPCVCLRTDCRRSRPHAVYVLANHKGEQTMKRSAFRSPQTPEFPTAWREAEYAALWADAADTSDDRVSENYFDVEDERAEVDIIAHNMLHGAN